MGNLRWRINVPKLRVDSWMNHMDTLISFSTWIFIDFNGYSQIFSLYQKCPPKPVLPSLSFFFHPKKSQISNSYFVSSLSDFFISNDTNLSQLLPKKQTTSHFYMTYPTSTRNCYFYCLLNPIHFFSQKNKPLCPIIAITKCNEMTRQIQKETKFRFITKHITPFPQKRDQKNKKMNKKMLKKEWLNAKPKHFLLPLATTTFINALIHSEKISIKMHKNKKNS